MLTIPQSHPIPPTPAAVENPNITFESLKIVLFSGILQGLVPGPLWVPKPTGVQVPYIKCME